MELSERKKRILATVVQSYIMNGEPVGSKALCDILGGVSSATIRNDMSELAELGYLAQPHTSAGRIPTAQSYRLYIDRLMTKHTLTPQERERIDSLLPDGAQDGDRILRVAAQSLSLATGCAAFATTQTAAGTLIHRVELIPMVSGNVLLVLVTSTGEVRSRMFNLPCVLTEQMSHRFIELVSASLIGRRISDIHPATLQTLAVSSEFALELSSLIWALGELIEETGEARLETAGETRLMSCPEFSLSKAREILELTSRPDEMCALLDSWDKESGVIIGSDTSFSSLDRTSLVLARYRMGDAQTGYIGVIGPMRMDYDTLLPGIEYFASLISTHSAASESMKGLN